MRGTDPLASPVQRAWWDAGRDRVAAWSSFACPSEEALHAILTFASHRQARGQAQGQGQGGTIVEVGAGTGYWALQLQQAARTHGMPGIRVEAYDKRPPGTLPSPTSSGGGGGGGGGANEYHGHMPCWTLVQAGGAAQCAESAGKAHATLLLCYPPPGVDAMGLAALQAYSSAGGRQVVLVGEWRGDTGTARMEGELYARWELVKVLPLPNWPHTVANVTLWRYRGRGSAPSLSPAWPLSCAVCGKCPAPSDKGQWGRDRVTRAVVVCSPACACSPSAREALHRECTARHLPPVYTDGDAPWSWEGAGWELGLGSVKAVGSSKKSLWRWGSLLT